MHPHACRFAFLLLMLGWPAAAVAQSATAALVGPADPTLHSTASRPGLPDFRMPRGDYRQPPGPVRGGLIGAVPLSRDLQVAVGRFAVPNFSSPRIEPAEIRRRDRNIAAVGLALRF